MKAQEHMNHRPPPEKGYGGWSDLGGVEKCKQKPMRAAMVTQLMLGWWLMAGVERADLAVKRASDKMVWQRDLPLAELPLPWARAENVRGAEVYIRPARGYAWRLVFLDDVPIVIATRVARKYDALIIETSKAGGCHTWLRCSKALDEAARLQAQRWLTTRIEADPASVSGAHLGRLAGFKNWKRGGTWVNVVVAPQRGKSWQPEPALENAAMPAVSTAASLDQVCRPAPSTTRGDSSESGKEWGWICGRLEAGCDPSTVYKNLVERANSRRGKDAQRYAARTINQALRAIRSKGVLQL